MEGPIYKLHLNVGDPEFGVSSELSPHLAGGFCSRGPSGGAGNRGNLAVRFLFSILFFFSSRSLTRARPGGWSIFTSLSPGSWEHHRPVARRKMLKLTEYVPASPLKLRWRFSVTLAAVER